MPFLSLLPTQFLAHQIFDANNGRTVVVSLNLHQTECARLNIPCHFFAGFVAFKQNVDLGRFIP